MKKLTIDTVEEILAELWEASKHPSVSKDYRIELQLRMGHFFNANTEESKSEFRRLKIQGADALEPEQGWKPMDIEKDIDRLTEETGSMEELFGEEFRKCPECGGGKYHGFGCSRDTGGTNE